MAQELVHFLPLEDNGRGVPPTRLDGYVYRASGEGRRPALVFLHGCGGLFSRTTELIDKREREWASHLTQRGYAVLMVDSFGPRGQGEMCSQHGFNRENYLKRPQDAYGALAFLQAQDWVRSDRVGVIGWSEGGGTVLFAIRTQSLGRPPRLPQGDFRAAVAFIRRRATSDGKTRGRALSRSWCWSVPRISGPQQLRTRSFSMPPQSAAQRSKCRSTPVRTTILIGPIRRGASCPIIGQLPVSFRSWPPIRLHDRMHSPAYRDFSTAT